MAKKAQETQREEDEASTRLSNREIIIEQLNRMPGWKKQATGGWFMVCCPFPDHDDGSPSCGVRVAEPALGVFNCLGCGKKGGWNRFAEVAGLEPIKEWNTAEDVEFESIIPKDMDDKLLGDQGLTFKHVLKQLGAKEAMLWPERINWRSFPGEFMRNLGAHIANDSKIDSVSAIFPIKVAGKVRGGIRAKFEKDENNKRALTYVNSAGGWVQDFGLFPYVYVRSMIRKRKLNFVVLVEGPRDAMRLCLNGIPALAVLGANNITKRKIMFATSLGVDIVYAIPDPDKAGTSMWKTVRKLCREAGVPSKRIKLPPKHKDGSKLDPGNATKKVLRDLSNFLAENHKFKPAKVMQ